MVEALFFIHIILRTTVAFYNIINDFVNPGCCPLEEDIILSCAVYDPLASIWFRTTFKFLRYKEQKSQ